MINLTTISWWTFLIGSGFLLLIWLLTTKTRYGRIVITRETPWNLKQWSMILVIIGITMFILVNPIFHLMTTGIFAILYYIFINKNLLSKNIGYIGKVGDYSRAGLQINNNGKCVVDIECKGVNFSGELAERKALNKCLFSFITLSENPFPEVNYINGVYHVHGELSTMKYYSSLIHYLQKSGFETAIKNKK